MVLQNVIDGDLCEQYNSIDYKKKRSIAEDLDRTPNEVSFAFVFRLASTIIT